MRNEKSWASISNQSDYEFYAKAEKLSKRRLFYLLIIFPFPIMLLVFLALEHFFNFSLGKYEPYFLVIFSNLSVAGMIFFAISTRKLSRLTRDNLVLRILKKYFSSVDFSLSLSISDSLIHETNLYKFDHSARCNHCFKARHWNTSFIFSNVTLNESIPDHDGQIDSMEVFKGQWLVIDLEYYHEPRVIKGNSFDYLCITGERAHIVKKNNYLFRYSGSDMSKIKINIQKDVSYIKELLDEYLDIMKDIALQG